jgi:hypothetical protein
MNQYDAWSNKTYKYSYGMCFKSNLMTLFIWYYLHMLYMFRVLITHLQEQLLRIEAVGITTCGCFVL